MIRQLTKGVLVDQAWTCDGCGNVAGVDTSVCDVPEKWTETVYRWRRKNGDVTEERSHYCSACGQARGLPGAYLEQGTVTK